MSRHLATLAGALLALAAVALADDNKAKQRSEPQIPSGAPSEVKRVRFIGADTTPTKAGQLEGGPRSVAFSADGKLIAVGAIDGGVGVTGVTESSDSVAGWTRVAEHLGAVSGVAFLPVANGIGVVSVGDDELLRVTLLDASLAPVSSASRALGLGPLTALAVLDATHVAVGSARGSLAIVKLGDQILVERTVERHEGSLVALAVIGTRATGGSTAVPRVVASAGWDGLVKLTETSSGKELKSAKVSNVELTALSASADGRLLAVGSWKTGVALLDPGSLKVLATVDPHRGAANGILLAGKNTLVGASVADEMLSVSELGAKNELKGTKRTRITTVPTGALAASPDGALIACAANDGSIGIYQLEGRPQ